MWTSARRLLLAVGDEDLLQGLVRGRNTAQKVALRARIILGAAEGLANNRLAKQLGVTRPTILLWRQRYAKAGVAGLLRDAPRPGRRQRIGARQVEAIVNATLHTTPRDAMHRSTRTLARAQGVSEATVRRIWRAHGLQPQRTETFKLSRDPRFARKLREVVGLYLNPPDKALVLSVNAKGQTQALDRTEPVLPLRPGIPARQTHDYIRHDTTTLVAALNVLQGTVSGSCLPRQRHLEFLAFLERIERAAPRGGRDVHLILDNYGTRTHPKVQACWFADITRKRIRGGTFHSVRELNRAISE